MLRSALNRIIHHLQRRDQPIYGLTCPMRSRRGSNPLIPFRGLTCIPSMRLTVRPLLPVGRAVAPVEDVCRARPSFRSVLSLSIRGMRSVAICPLRSRRGSNPLIPFSGTRRFSRPVPYRSATAPRQAYRRPSRRFEAIFTFGCALGGVTRIRTEGTAHTVQRFSRPPHSAALP